MIKYYQELEKPNKFYLSFLNPYYECSYTFTPPLSFWAEHYEIFGAIREINGLIEFIKDDVAKIGCVPFDIDERWDYYGTISKLNELISDEYILCNPIILLLKEQKCDITQNEAMSIPTELDLPFDTDTFERIKEKSGYISIRELINFYIDFLYGLSYVNPEVFSNFKNHYEILKNAENDFSKYTIQYYDASIEKFFLPNAWFITPIGDLYNSCGKDGHKNANLLYNYDHWEKKFKSMDKRIEVPGGKIHPAELEDRLKIIEDRFVTISDFKEYLNLIYNPISIETPNDDFSSFYQRQFSRKIYDLNTVKIVLGVVSATASLNRFWLDLAANTNNPSIEFEKVRTMTENRIEDILVKCAGFHKIETNLKKTITTSSLDNLQKFEEYLEKGWNISIVPPIIINKEKGIVEELDISAPYMERYIEKNIEPYKEPDAPGHGKIYCKHLNYGKF